MDNEYPEFKPKLPDQKKLRESFDKVYDGPNRLQHEFELFEQAQQFNMSLEDYRRLYELRSEQPFPNYPKPKQWWIIPVDWSRWFKDLPPKNKWLLLRKGAFRLVQSGILITILGAVGRYIWETPKREKQAHYQAWHMINSARGQKHSGGRIEALQDLNKDGISLQGLDTEGANLRGIKLQGADLRSTNLKGSILSCANLKGASFWSSSLESTSLHFINLEDANLQTTNLESASLVGANLKNTNLEYANLKNSDLFNANLENANLEGAILDGANLFKVDLRKTRGLNSTQVKSARNWWLAFYNDELRERLNLPISNKTFEEEIEETASEITKNPDIKRKYLASGGECNISDKEFEKSLDAIRLIRP